jgi:PleD family two-component response regulator
MKMADRALYESKNSGKNKVTVTVQEKNDSCFK